MVIKNIYSPLASARWLSLFHGFNRNKPVFKSTR